MSVFSELKPTNHANRNGFDLGRFSSFSSKAGYILPVFQQGTLPSSEYSVDIKQLLRTQPLQKAAFTGMSINYDIVWVPYNHLYSSFNQFISQRQNKHLTVQPSNQFIPQFGFGAFVKRVFCLALADYMLSFCTDMVSNGSDDAAEPSLVYHNFIAYSSHLPNESIYLGVLRQLDMLEYCNLLPILKNLYAKLTQMKYVTDASRPHQSLDWTKWSDTLENGQIVKYGLYRFFDEQNLASNPFEANLEDFFNKMYSFIDRIKPVGSRFDVEDIFDKIGGVDEGEYQPNLWSVLAYNKFFSEYYRNTYYDLKFGVYRPSFGMLYQFDYVYLFNLDDYYQGMFSPGAMNCDTQIFNRLLCMFAIKPHAYKKDMFTGVLPSSQFGDVELMVTDNDFHKLLGNSPLNPGILNVESGQVVSAQNTNLSNLGLEVRNGGNFAGYSDKFKFDPALAISVLETRRADAMQRFKERMLRAGVDAKDIFKAHGWSEPKSEAQFDPVFVGSFDGRLDINVVSSTAETQTAELAQLGANATAVVEGHKVKINTSDFGVLMILFHIDKEAPYDAYGMRPEHTFTEAFDYPYPELQNISLAPVPSEYLNLYNDINKQAVIGFLPRAIGYKTAVDKVHGEFYSCIPYTPRVSDPREEIAGIEGGSDSFVTGIFSDWVAPKEDIRSFNNISFLYISPRCTDPIFKVAANSRQDTDNFVINARFDCYAVEPLPVIGLPY